MDMGDRVTPLRATAPRKLWCCLLPPDRPKMIFAQFGLSPQHIIVSVPSEVHLGTLPQWHRTPLLPLAHLLRMLQVLMNSYRAGRGPLGPSRTNRRIPCARTRVAVPLPLGYPPAKTYPTRLLQEEQQVLGRLSYPFYLGPSLPR